MSFFSPKFRNRGFLAAIGQLRSVEMAALCENQKIRAMQSESISLQSQFNMQASEKTQDDDEPGYCSIDCYIGNCYFSGHSAVILHGNTSNKTRVSRL
jgi:hypothetical protein